MSQNALPSKKIVLINPRSTYVHEIPQKCYPPAHLLYLAASLRQAGYVPDVIDANAFGLPDSQVLARMGKTTPLVTGLSVYSEILPQIRQIAAMVRAHAPQTAIVLGGPHATSVPEATLRQFPEADYVLTGEAETSLPLLCQAVEKKQGFENVPGLFYREKGVVRMGPAPVFPDPEALPLPAKDLVARAYLEKRYFSLLVRKRPVDTLITSRGCPFSCGFCYNFRHKYRARKPESVVQELALIRDSGIRDVEICDDTFTVDEHRALRILDLIIAEKLDISFRIKSRVDVFSRRLAKRARQAGVYLVAFGMESGSQKILDAMNKKITLEQSAQACALTREMKIACHTSWVMGYPGETPESIQDTVRFILKNRPTTANIAVLRPYPNTPVYQMAKANGTLAGDWSPDATEFPWVRLPWAPEKKILDSLCTRALLRIYFSPHYTAAFASRMVKGANWVLFRYALQETLKVISRRGPG